MGIAISQVTNCLDHALFVSQLRNFMLFWYNVYEFSLENDLL